MTDLLKSHRVLICAGTGGVGKTTLSAALGVLAAREGLRTLVLTIDPARRLAQALGLESRPGEEVSVPGVEGLHAAMMDPRREFDEFVLGTLDKGLAKGLFQNRLYQQLVSNLQGNQEFTSLVRLLQSVRSGRYDLVILDTPPTQNAVDFLRAPERIYALFQDSVIGWFSNPQHPEGWVKRTLHRGTRLVTTALEAVTGSVFIRELRDFFSHLTHLQARVASVSDDVGKLLHASSTGFVLVTGFDELKLRECLEFQRDLAEESLNLRAIVVNRWFPEWTRSEQSVPANWTDNPDFAKLRQFYDEFSEFFKHRAKAFDDFSTQVEESIPIVRLPDFKNAVQGIEDLIHVAEVMEEKWRRPI